MNSILGVQVDNASRSMIVTFSLYTLFLATRTTSSSSPLALQNLLITPVQSRHIAIRSYASSYETVLQYTLGLLYCRLLDDLYTLQDVI